MKPKIFWSFFAIGVIGFLFGDTLLVIISLCLLLLLFLVAVVIPSPEK